MSPQINAYLAQMIGAQKKQSKLVCGADERQWVVVGLGL